MQSVVKTADGNKIIIHYVYNKVTGTFDSGAEGTGGDGGEWYINKIYSN